MYLIIKMDMYFNLDEKLSLMKQEYFQSAISVHEMGAFKVHNIRSTLAQ